MTQMGWMIFKQLSDCSEFKDGSAAKHKKEMLRFWELSLEVKVDL